jgi:hypothetical protein
MRLFLRVVKYEFGIWKSLYLWMFHRPNPANAFSYAKSITPILWAFVVLSLVEIPVADTLIPWPTVRIVFLVLGAWALIWMIGLLASMRVYPHLVDEDGLRVRYSFNTEILVPWKNVVTVRRKMRSYTKSRVIQPDGEAIGVVVGSMSNVDIVLREPMTFREHTFTELYVFADDPAALTLRMQDFQPSGTH